MLAKNSPVLKILNQKINMLSLSPEEKKLYESRMKLKSDIATYSEAEFNRGREEGIAQGVKEGIAQGMKEGIFETAKNCLKLKMPIETIQSITGLTKEEIENL